MQLVAIIVIVAVVLAVVVDALAARACRKPEPYREREAFPKGNEAIVTTQKIIVDLTKRH